MGCRGCGVAPELPPPPPLLIADCACHAVLRCMCVPGGNGTSMPTRNTTNIGFQMLLRGGLKTGQRRAVTTAAGRKLGESELNRLLRNEGNGWGVKISTSQQTLRCTRLWAVWALRGASSSWPRIGPRCRSISLKPNDGSDTFHDIHFDLVQNWWSTGTCWNLEVGTVFVVIFRTDFWSVTRRSHAEAHPQPSNVL